MNFKRPSLSDQLPEWLKIDLSFGNKRSKKNEKPAKKINFNFSLSGKLDATERWLLRGAAGVLMLVLLYSGFSLYLDNRISDKISEAQEVSNYTDTQISLADSDISKVRLKANEYKEMEENLRSINAQIQDDLSFKNTIPNLLVSIMDVIPKEVQITEIENTVASNERHIIIKVQSKYYDELGYFKAKLKEDGILKNIVSTQGEKQGDFVKIVIEGDLP